MTQNQAPTPAPASTLVPAATRKTPPPKSPQPQPVSTPTPEDEIFPRFSASEAPVRRADRIAWQIWVVCVLLTVALTLVFYLIDKVSVAFKG